MLLSESQYDDRNFISRARVLENRPWQYAVKEHTVKCKDSTMKAFRIFCNGEKQEDAEFVSILMSPIYDKRFSFFFLLKIELISNGRGCNNVGITCRILFKRARKNLGTEHSDTIPSLLYNVPISEISWP